MNPSSFSQNKLCEAIVISVVLSPHRQGTSWKAIYYPVVTGIKLYLQTP